MEEDYWKPQWASPDVLPDGSSKDPYSERIKELEMKYQMGYGY